MSIIKDFNKAKYQLIINLTDMIDGDLSLGVNKPAVDHKDPIWLKINIDPKRLKNIRSFVNNISDHRIEKIISELYNSGYWGFVPMIKDGDHVIESMIDKVIEGKDARTVLEYDYPNSKMNNPDYTYDDEDDKDLDRQRNEVSQKFNNKDYLNLSYKQKDVVDRYIKQCKINNKSK